MFTPVKTFTAIQITEIFFNEMQIGDGCNSLDEQKRN